MAHAKARRALPAEERRALGLHSPQRTGTSAGRRNPAVGRQRTTNTRALIALRLVTALVLNTSIDFLTMDGNITRCIDGQPHFVSAYVHDRQLDVRPNHNSFTAFSTQDQHGVFLLSGWNRCSGGYRPPSMTIPRIRTTWLHPAVSRIRSCLPHAGVVLNNDDLCPVWHWVHNSDRRASRPPSSPRWELSSSQGSP